METKKGMVRVEKVPKVINTFFKEALSGYDRVMCNQQADENGATFTFQIKNRCIIFSVKEG